MGSPAARRDAGDDGRCVRVRRRGRWGLVLVSVALVLGGCGGDGSDSGTGDTDTTEVDMDTTVGPGTTDPEVVTTVLVGVVVGGNSGGVGENQTDSLSETVRTSDTECRGWFGQDTAPEPWTSRLQQGATVRVFDDDGELLGTGTLGPGRPRNLTPDDDDDGDRWQCEFGFELDEVVTASAYYVEVAGLEPVEAEDNPLEPDAVVVPVNTPLDPDLVEACSEELFGVVSEWRAVGAYWSRGVEDLCSNGLRVRNIRRQCRPADLATLQVISVVDTDGRVLENRTSDGPTVDVDTLTDGTLVDVNVTSAVPCG